MRDAVVTIWRLTAHRAATPAGGLQSAMAEAGGLRMGTAAGRWVLATTVLGSGIVMIDGTAVNVALARIG